MIFTLYYLGENMSQYSEDFEKYKQFFNKHVRYDYSIFDIPKSAKILDVGCGFGDRIEILKSMDYTKVFGIDIDEHMVKEAQEKGLNVSFGAIEDTKLDEAQFDIILVENVFHHISLYEKALDELYRILKPGGVLCIIEPRFSIFRYILDFVTFKTPVPNILRGPWKLRYNVMSQEIESGMYPLWRKSQNRFFTYLRKKYKVAFHKKNIWFHFIKVEKIN